MSRPLPQFCLLFALLAVPAAAEDWTPVASAGTSRLVEQDTRLKNIDPIFMQLFLPDADQGVNLRSILQLFPVDPDLLGVRRAQKGRARVTTGCQGPGGQRSLGTRTVRADQDGNMVFTQEVAATLNCEFFFLEWDFLGKLKVPADTSIEADMTAELIGPGADPACFDENTLCLNGDRFKVEVDWAYPGGPSGVAVGLPRTDDSGLFYFFDPNNWEFLVKVLDGCGFNDHFWVFAAATTDVEYTLKVTDTQTNQSRTYTNPFGRPAPAVVDTDAFATCP